MLENYMFDIVDNYIENEINYIKSDETCSGLTDADIEDIYMLQHLTPNQKQEIADNVLNDLELEEKINELIHYYLYH